MSKLTLQLVDQIVRNESTDYLYKFVEEGVDMGEKIKHLIAEVSGEEQGKRGQSASASTTESASK